MSLKKNKSGFTLVELLITIAILSIVMAAVTNLLISNNKVYQSNKTVLEIQQDTRYARTILVRDFRALSSLSSIHANELTGETYTYLMDGNDFVRKEVDDLDKKLILLKNATEVVFNYLDSLGNGTTSVTDVRTIEFKLCGEASGNVPLLSENYQHCIKDSAVIRNSYY